MQRVAAIQQQAIEDGRLPVDLLVKRRIAADVRERRPVIRAVFGGFEVSLVFGTRCIDDFEASLAMPVESRAAHVRLE